MITLKESILADNAIKESILADMNDTLAQGDELDKNIKAEIKEFLKAIATAKNYEGFGYKNGRSTSFFVPNALKQMGYDANHIEIIMYTLDNNYTTADDWVINIKFAKYSDNQRFEQYTWDKNIYGPLGGEQMEWHCKGFN